MRIIGFSSYEPGYQQLSAEGRLQLDEEPFGWVADGPAPWSQPEIFGVEAFEDVTLSGFRITYLVSEARALGCDPSGPQGDVVITRL